MKRDVYDVIIKPILNNIVLQVMTIIYRLLLFIIYISTIVHLSIC